MHHPRMWGFVSDMNRSGTTTISDVWLWFKWLYFYPGDLVVSILINNKLKELSDIGNFFELSVSSYGDVFSGVVSFMCWFVVFVCLMQGYFEWCDSRPLHTKK